MPSAPPMMSPMMGAHSPTTSEIRAPWTSLESSSRPRPSVPSQCSMENGARRSSMSMSVGLGSGSTGARIATANMKIIQPIAIQNSSPNRRPRFAGCAVTPSSIVSSSVAMTNPGVEDGVEQIHNEVHDHETGGNDQHHTLQDDEVAGINRADQEPADPRKREDRLHDDGAADQSPDIDAGDRDQRQRGRFQRVHERDARALQSLGFRQRDIVFLQGRDHV